MKNSPPPDVKVSCAGLFAGIISGLVEKFLSYERSVASNPSNKIEFHDMRIAGKPLRYFLEVLEPLYGKKAEVCVNELVIVLDAMGTIHDHDVAITILSDYMKELHRYNKRQTSASRKIPVSLVGRLLREQRRTRKGAYNTLRAHLMRWRRDRIAQKILHVAA